MDALSGCITRLADQVRQMGGSLPWRIGILALALLMNIGFYLPDVPGAAFGQALPGTDKVAHVAVFALTVWAAGRLLAPRRRFPMGWIVIAAILHAGLVEMVQGVALTRRAADPADLLADLIGITLGIGIWLLERQRARRRTVDKHRSALHSERRISPPE